MLQPITCHRSSPHTIVIEPSPPPGSLDAGKKERILHVVAISDDARSDGGRSTHVPVRMKIFAVLMVSLIGFGSHWSSEVTGAMNEVNAKEGESYKPECRTICQSMSKNQTINISRLHGNISQFVRRHLDNDNNAYDHVVFVYVILAAGAVLVGETLFVWSFFTNDLKRRQWTRKERQRHRELINEQREAYETGYKAKLNRKVSGG